MAESTRFLILSRGRTGSTFLQRLLDSHTECICFEELYAPRPVPPSPPKCPADRFAGMLAGADLRDTDPVAFLEQSVHRPIDGIGALGFKLFYGHSRQGAAAALWTHLGRDRSIRVVHLKRRNLLRMFTSMKIALKTGAWWSLDGEPGLEDRRVTLDAAEFARYVDEVESARATGAAAFSAHPVFDIDYEDFEDYGHGEGGDEYETLSALLDFLGLRPFRLHTAMARQNPEPLRELIANHDDLAAAFAGTPAACYFQAA